MVKGETGSLGTAEHARDARRASNKISRGFLDGGIVQVNVGHLVICNCECLARARVEEFQTKLVFNGQPALLPKQPIQVNGPVHGRASGR